MAQEYDFSIYSLGALHNSLHTHFYQLKEVATWHHSMGGIICSLALRRLSHSLGKGAGPPSVKYELLWEEWLGGVAV